MQLRRATIDDALDVLEWRNDPQSVAASKTGAVNRDTHLAWFPKAVVDEQRAIFIAEEDGRKIGMIRFDRDERAWTVSINLAPDQRGKGYGDRILSAGINAIGSPPLIAEIKDDNIASIRLFERCGFRRISHEDGWLHYTRP
jgi:RimJ/RimL family protein N-acetyltransferase